MPNNPEAGIINVLSHHSVDQTVEKFKQILESNRWNFLP